MSGRDRELAVCRELTLYDRQDLSRLDVLGTLQSSVFRFGRYSQKGRGARERFACGSRRNQAIKQDRDLLRSQVFKVVCLPTLVSFLSRRESRERYS